MKYIYKKISIFGWNSVYTWGAGSSTEFQKTLTLESIDHINKGSVVLKPGKSTQIDVWGRNKEE